MNTAMKKLILALITALLGALSSGAMADTNYDFNYASDNSFVCGVFLVNNSNIIASIFL